MDVRFRFTCKLFIVGFKNESIGLLLCSTLFSIMRFNIVDPLVSPCLIYFNNILIWFQFV